MPPIYNNFVCPSGETLSVGKFVTSPDPGMRVNISKNNGSSVDYDYALNGGTEVFNKWWNGYGQGSRCFTSASYAWSGFVWAPNYSTHGAIVVMGGGHGGNQGVFAYIFDLATRTWSMKGAPGNLPTNFEWAGFLNSTQSTYTSTSDLRDANWRDYLYSGSYIFLLNHSYNTINYVSPAEGGGTKGSLLIPSAPLTQNPSDAPTRWAPHLFNLDTGVCTRAMTLTPTATLGVVINDDNNTVSVKDTTRSNIWYFQHGSTTALKQSLTGGPPFAFSAHPINRINGTLTDTYIAATARPFEYVPEADAIVSILGENPIHVFDMSTGIPVDLKRVGMPAYTFARGGAGVSMAWCPPQQAFYLYEGMGDTFCTVLRPSSLNFATCSWTWSRESFGGVVPVNGRGIVTVPTTYEGAYRRFFWAPALGCFAWQDGPTTTGVCLDSVTRDGVAQLWRPPGTVIA